MRYAESDMQFEFAPGWVVRRYDAHRHYIGLSGRGLKGVDFIAFHPVEGRLLFVEVKNFRQRSPKYTLSAQRTDPHLLADKVAAKVRDTLTAIDAITRQYRRHWWYRLLWPWLRRSQRFDWEAVYWTAIDQMLNHPPLEVVLWLELDGPDDAFRQACQAHCAALLVGVPAEVTVASMTDHPTPAVLWATLE